MCSREMLRGIRGGVGCWNECCGCVDTGHCCGNGLGYGKIMARNTY